MGYIRWKYKYDSGDKNSLKYCLMKGCNLSLEGRENNQGGGSYESYTRVFSSRRLNE